VGESGINLIFRTHQPLLVDCKGHGSRQSRRNNEKGFPVISVKIDEKTGKKVVTPIKPKTNYSHATAGDIVKVKLEEDRKPRKKDSSSDESNTIKTGTYCSRVKTPTPKGVEVVIQGRRITAQLKQIQFLHRSDGYAYRFAPVLSNLLQCNATSSHDRCFAAIDLLQQFKQLG
jgi:hypothetical protein